MTPHQQLDARLGEFAMRYADDRIVARVHAIESEIKGSVGVMHKVEVTQRAVTELCETLRAQVRLLASRIRSHHLIVGFARMR